MSELEEEIADYEPLRLFAAVYAQDLEFPTLIPVHLIDWGNFDKEKREDETVVDRGHWSESVHQTQTLEGLMSVA